MFLFVFFIIFKVAFIANSIVFNVWQLKELSLDMRYRKSKFRVVNITIFGGYINQILVRHNMSCFKDVFFVFNITFKINCLI